MAKKTAFLKELVDKARKYGRKGHYGYYPEIMDFVKWCFEKEGEKVPTDEELEPYD
ncbi:MAG: hypothetical protein ACETVZ_00195 [Phycisphaerae bacterium]